MPDEMTDRCATCALDDPTARRALVDEIVSALERAQPTRARLLNMDAAAEYFGCSPAALRKRILRRQVPVTHVGGRVMFDRKALDAWIARNTTQPVTGR